MVYLPSRSPYLAVSASLKTDSNCAAKNDDYYIYRKSERSGAARSKEQPTNERLISVICQHIAEKAANAVGAHDIHQLVALLSLRPHRDAIRR